MSTPASGSADDMPWSECVEAAARVLDTIDWRALGDVYFHEEGEQHWRKRRGELERLGLLLAKELVKRLGHGGTSLWCGAGVAEVPALVAEAMICGRRLVVANPIREECRILNEALVQAVPDLNIRYEPMDAQAAPGEGFDHVGCISVFTDPETWPMLSGVAYGRVPPVQVDVEQFVAERDEARELATSLVSRLGPGGWITTTAEEVAWFLEQAVAADFDLDADEELVETAVVGDPVGFLRRS